MSKQSKASNNGGNENDSTSLLQQRKLGLFHDFLGTRPSDSTLLPAPKTSDARFAEASPSPSPSPSASAGGFSGRGPISPASDLGSERQVGSHLEGIPFFGARSDFSGPEISQRLTGSKRSISDLAFIGHDSVEGLHLMKMVRHGPGSEQSRRSNDDDGIFGMQPSMHSSASLILHPPTASRVEATVSKWDRPLAMNMGSAVQYPSQGAPFVHFMHQAPSNRSKDVNAGPLGISNSAADEGSRTGKKGPGILSSINAILSHCEKNSSGVLQSSSRQKSVVISSEPELSVSASRHVCSTNTKQMTIFYAGQAHVFDDVHPNKADVIMALAGSNGGSWSTAYSPKSALKQIKESYVGNGLEAASKMPFAQEFNARVSTTTPAAGSVDRTLLQTGAPPGNLVTSKDAWNAVQAAVPASEEKRGT